MERKHLERRKPKVLRYERTNRTLEETNGKESEETVEEKKVKQGTYNFNNPKEKRGM